MGLGQQLMLLGILFALIGSGNVGHALGCKGGRRKTDYVRFQDLQSYVVVNMWIDTSVFHLENL